MSVLIETTVGDLVFDLYLKERPRTSMNFLKLCKMKYYNFSLFHSVQRNFMAQTGDPEGTGRGGFSVFQAMYGDQAKFFEAETNPKIKHTKIGTLSMVNNGNDMHGSQFFFTLGEDLDYLDGVHTVFGELAEGLDTLVKINDAICDDEFRPYKDIRISHTIVLHDPFEEPKELVYPQSPEPTREQLSSGRIDADEEVDENQGKSMEQIEEELKDKEARARATILEMIGDIPDADVRPPEDVLFVCKLNPVTTDEDLEIIFGRFGNVLSCEIIRDHKTGDSLQYGFIEFDNPKSCEDAYFKMNNVLIDDRRIHVDFSQSVSKIRWKGKGKGVVYENEKARQELNRGRDFTDKKQDPGSRRENRKIIDSLKSSLKDVKDKEMHRNSHGSRRREDYHSRERGRREDRSHEERGYSRHYSHQEDRHRDRHDVRDKVRTNDSHRSRDRVSHFEAQRRDPGNSSRYRGKNGSVRDLSEKSRSAKNSERPSSHRGSRPVKSKSDDRHVRTEHKKKRQPSSSESSSSDTDSDDSYAGRKKPKSFSRKGKRRRSDSSSS